MNSTALIIEVYAAGAVTGAGLMWLWATRQVHEKRPIPPEWLPKENPMPRAANLTAADLTTFRAAPKPYEFAPKPRSTTWTKESPKPPTKPDPVRSPSMPHIDWGNCK